MNQLIRFVFSGKTMVVTVLLFYLALALFRAFPNYTAWQAVSEALIGDQEDEPVNKRNGPGTLTSACLRKGTVRCV
jgi:hypothetical protein